jgi:hypothetical protein
MGTYIKDEQVHAMARELTDRRVTSVTNALPEALRAELNRCHTAAPGQEEEAARREALHQLLSRCRDLPWPDQRSSSELQSELYDETGLPA